MKHVIVKSSICACVFGMSAILFANTAPPIPPAFVHIYAKALDTNSTADVVLNTEEPDQPGIWGNFGTPQAWKEDTSVTLVPPLVNEGEAQSSTTDFTGSLQISLPNRDGSKTYLCNVTYAGTAQGKQVPKSIVSGPSACGRITTDNGGANSLQINIAPAK